MSEGTKVLLIMAGVMALTALFVVVLVFFGRIFEWLNIVTERYFNFSISCEHCGAPLSLKGKNCRSCGKPISQSLLKQYKLRMLTVSSFGLTFLVITTGYFLVFLILLALSLVFLGYERHYAKTMRNFKDPKQRA
jgi:ribosomal protein L40E